MAYAINESLKSKAVEDHIRRMNSKAKDLIDRYETASRDPYENQRQVSDLRRAVENMLPIMSLELRKRYFRINS